MPEVRPLFCPNCGAKLTDPYAVVHLHADETPNAAGVWDTYCAACEWSGDIWPDKESGGVEADPTTPAECGSLADLAPHVRRWARVEFYRRGGLTEAEATEYVLAEEGGQPIPEAIADKVDAIRRASNPSLVFGDGAENRERNRALDEAVAKAARAAGKAFREAEKP